MFEGLRKKGKGLYSPYARDRRKINAIAEEGQKIESETFHARKLPRWNYFDSEPKDTFITEEIGEGFGDVLSFPEVQDWVEEQHKAGKKIASLDVFGQPGLGLAAGVDKAVGWSLFDARPMKRRGGDLREKMIEGSAFDVSSRAEVFKYLNELKSQGTGLGLVFFRPWGGVKEFRHNRYAHLYLYEFILRPLYERLEVGGMMILASHGLVGMPLLTELLEQTEGVEVVRNDTKRAYVIRKKSATTQLKRLSEIEHGLGTKLKGKFIAAELQGHLTDIENQFWDVLRERLGLK